MLTVYVLKNGVGRYNTFFFNFYTKSSYLCRFRFITGQPKLSRYLLSATWGRTGQLIQIEPGDVQGSSLKSSLGTYWEFHSNRAEDTGQLSIVPEDTLSSSVLRA